MFLAKFTIVVILSHCSVKQFEKVEKLKKIADVPPHQEWKFLRFLQKWDALVAKDGKSCEPSEIGHSKSISASFLGERLENLQNDQNWLFLSQSKPLVLAKFTILGHFEPLWCETIKKSWKTEKICWCTHPQRIEKKIFKKLNVDFWIMFNFWWSVEQSKW